MRICSLLPSTTEIVASARPRRLTRRRLRGMRLAGRRPRRARSRRRPVLPHLVASGPRAAAGAGRRRPCGFDHERAAREALPLEFGCRTIAVDSNAYYARPAPRVADGVAQLAFLFHPDLADDPGLPYTEFVSISAKLC